MVLHGNIWNSSLIEDACRRLEEAGFNDGDHGDLAGRCEQVIRDYRKQRVLRLRRVDSDILAMAVSRKIVMEFARDFDAVRQADVELRKKADVELSTPEILAMGDVAFK